MSRKIINQSQLDELVFLFNKRDFQKLLAKARPLLKINKKSSFLNRIIGATEAELGQYDNAIICFKRLIQIDASQMSLTY